MIKFPTLLISFYDALCLFDGARLHEVDVNSWFFGISYIDDKIFVSNRKGISEYNCSFQKIDSIEFKTKEAWDIHQIQVKNNLLYFVNTHRRYISAINWENKEVMHLINVEHQHPNSIFILNSESALVTIKNRYECDKSSAVLCNLQTNKVVKEIACSGEFHGGWHNAFFEKEKFYVLSSNTGEIIVEDRKINVCETCEVENEYSWVRGAVSTKNYFIFGSCKNGDRDERISGHSYLLFFDKKMNFITKKKLNYGSIQDFRCLSEMDYIHGSKFKGKIIYD